MIRVLFHGGSWPCYNIGIRLYDCFYYAEPLQFECLWLVFMMFCLCFKV